MKRAILKKKGHSGFTLIEVIVGLTVAAIVGALLVSLVGTAVTGSAQLPYRLVQVYNMNQVMDNITADYISMLPQTNDVLTVLKGRIDDTATRNSRYGNCGATTSWLQYNGTTLVTGGSAANGILKVVISPPSGGAGVTHTALFTR